MLGHPVRTAQVARTVGAIARVGILGFLGLPQVSSVVAEEKGGLEEVHLVPEQGLGLSEGERHKVGG